MTSLLERIGNRSVLVDACVSPRLAKALRAKGLSVRHMNEINKRMPDTHIELFVLEPTDVLITHDRMFARFLGPRKAILLRQRKLRKIDWKEFVSELDDEVGTASLKYGLLILPLILLNSCLKMTRKLVLYCIGV
jgi:predicted nuclease of predicted toxin-antitoxin system